MNEEKDLKKAEQGLEIANFFFITITVFAFAILCMNFKAMSRAKPRLLSILSIINIFLLVLVTIIVLFAENSFFRGILTLLKFALYGLYLRWAKKNILFI